MPHPPHWQLGSEVLPVHLPTCSLAQSSSTRPCCLAGRGRLPQLSWPCLSSVRDAPAGAFSENTLLLVGSSVPLVIPPHSHPPR